MQLSASTLQFIEEHRSDDVRTLALKAANYPEVDLPEAMVQISGRQYAAKKIPSWYATEGISYPHRLALEQCSSEATARYKASVLQGRTLTDLTGGFGIDCAFLSAGFQEAIYVERQKELCEAAAHNFSLLGPGHITVKNEDAVYYLQHMEEVDCIYIDPARRDTQGKKKVKLSDCEPDVSALEALLLHKAHKAMIKLSPMLDLSQALGELRHTEEVHIVSVDNECKELLLILNRDATGEIPIHCVNLTGKQKDLFIFTREKEQSAICVYTDKIETYLYEPNASILKAGAFRSIAVRYGLKKLHPNSHLYTSHTLIKDFPGRSFEITAECSFNKKEMSGILSDLKKAHITVRNFPAAVEELRKRTKLNEGGDVYLFATILADESKRLIRCKKA